MLALDAKGATKRSARRRRQEERRRFQKVHRAERYFSRQLKRIAKAVGEIVDTLAPGGIVKDLPEITTSLERYAERIDPWAKAVAASTVADIARRDESAWADLGRQIGRNLAAEIRSAPTGAVMRQKVDERVDLIKSLPREAAQRVHRIVLEGMSDSTRAAEYAKEIRRSGEVTESRAMLIARTETTSAATALVEARARHIGSTGYVWRTANDSDVRKSHREMEGEFVAWDDPPTLDKMVGHAGAFPNCRCWPEPVLPDVIE